MTKNDLPIAFSTEFPDNAIDGSIIITGISPTLFWWGRWINREMHIIHDSYGWSNEPIDYHYMLLDSK